MQCLHPIEVPIMENGRKTKSYHLVPCGHCVACLQARQQDWVKRVSYEVERSLCSVFVTLTYDNEYLPYNVYPTLLKSDLQKFFKRLRKRTGIELRYFACGEYGTHTIRPHYHAIIWSKQIFKLEDIQTSWNLGHIQFGNVTGKSIAYVCKYVLKSSKYPEHSEKPFVVMSRRPGIGIDYVTEQTEKYHETHPYFVSNGFKTRLPRYYKDKMSLGVKSKKKDVLKQYYFDHYPNRTDYDYYLWLKGSTHNHEWLVEKHLKEKDKL